MGRLGRADALMADGLLAQINVGRLRAAEGDPQVADFFANLDRVNAIAEASDGFVWRLVDEDGADATGIAVGGDPLSLLNMSVWRDAASLAAYVYRTDHAEIMRQRARFFEPHEGPFQALWFVEADHRPFPEEGLERLDYLRRHGPGERAFTFASASRFGA